MTPRGPGRIAAWRWTLTPLRPMLCAATLLVGACQRSGSGGALEEPLFEGTVSLSWMAGGLEDKGGVLLESDPRSGAVRADGLAAAVDRRGSRVLLVGPDGHLRAKVGSRGQGPGELLDPFQVGFSGDSLLWVSDSLLGRITWFSMDGHAVDTWRASWQDIRGTPWSVRGNWVVGGRTLLGRPSLDPSSPGGEAPPRPLVLAPPDGNPEVVAWTDSPSPYGLLLRSDVGVVVSSMPQPIAGAPLVDLATGGEWFFILDRSPASGVWGSIRITRYDASGRVLGDLEIPYRPLPVDDGVREWVEAFVQAGVRAAQENLASMSSRFGRLELEDVMEAVWLPENLPPVRAALADDEGFWLQREKTYPRPEKRSGIWERYDLEGRLQARVLLPPAFRGLAGLRTRLFGYSRVEGVAELRSYEIRYHPPGGR